METTNETLSREYSVIGVPSSAGARRTGQELGPAALRASGLIQRLAASGTDVVDTGDLPSVTFRPDPDRPRKQNLDLVLDVARQVADLVESTAATGRVPLILGGDCSLSLGVVAGLLPRYSRLGLLYFDGDVDLNTPETTTSGVFDGMVISHLLGMGDSSLTNCGPRYPLLSEEDIVLFGYDLESGWIDPAEIELLDRSSSLRIPLGQVKASPTAAARAALRCLEEQNGAFLLHFDVDVMNFPAVDVFHPNGMSAEDAFEALSVLAAAPSCIAIAVTELNAERDPSAAHTSRLVEGLVRALGGQRDSPTRG